MRSPGDPLGPGERTGAAHGRRGIRTFGDGAVDDVEDLEEVEHRRPWLLGLQDHGVLVGCLDRR